MKLLNKTNRINLLISAFMLILSGYIVFILINNEINNDLNEKLYFNTLRIVEKLKVGKKVESIKPIIEIDMLKSKKNCIVIKDTNIYDDIEKDIELMREVSTSTNINGRYYKITVRHTIFEADDIVKSIFISLVFTLTLILIFSYIVTKKTFSFIWQIFYKNLKTLKEFKIDSHHKIEFVNSKIDEFDELFKSLLTYINKSQSDFKQIKEFSENASHEIQTPLAILQTQIEELIQEPNLSLTISSKLQTSIKAISRLSKINKLLLLLTKIENDIFAEKSKIVISQLINNAIDESEDLIQFKKLDLCLDIDEAIEINVNPFLFEIFISNLLSNAIKHNYESGNISINLSANELLFSNTSLNDITNPSCMFNRFAKSDSSNDSLGMGLSIIKTICERYDWKISYFIENNIHFLKIVF